MTLVKQNLGRHCLTCYFCIWKYTKERPLNCWSCHCLLTNWSVCNRNEIAIDLSDLSCHFSLFHDYQRHHSFTSAYLVSQLIVACLIVCNLVVAILLPGGLFCTANDLRKINICAPHDVWELSFVGRWPHRQVQGLKCPGVPFMKSLAVNLSENCLGWDCITWVVWVLIAVTPEGWHGLTDSLLIAVTGESTLLMSPINYTRYLGCHDSSVQVCLII